MNRVILLASVIVFSKACCLAAAEQEPLAPLPSRGESFALEEFSPFGTRELTRGQRAMCQKEPFAEVKKYPKFSSGKPLFGKVNFDSTPLDSSSGIIYYFAFDKSGLLGLNYDRLYFDLNRNLDLTDDKPLGIMKASPLPSDPGMRDTKTTVFEYLDVPFDYGKPYGTRDFRLLPQLMQSTQTDDAAVNFIAAAARKGRIKIADRDFDFLMGQAYFISGRYDRPMVYVQLDTIGYSPFEMQFLKAMRNIGGKLYAFSTNAIGDTLFVTPYEGDFGTFEIGAGGRNVKGLSMQGALESAGASFYIGDLREASAPDPGKPPELLSEFVIPTGDYLPGMFHVTFGRLRIFLSQNYHSDGMARDRQGRPPVYGIHVRKEEPFVLDFSNKPEVLFATPAKSSRVKRGDTIEVKAVLVDPVLDFMIRDIKDSTRKEKRTFNADTEQPVTFDTDVTLDPKVTVKDSSGNVVAEGKMPFG